MSSVHLFSGYSQEVVCYTLGNIPQMPSAPRLVRAGVTWITLQWSRPEGCSPEEVITYTLDIQEDENVSLARSTPAKHQDILWPKVKAALRSSTAVIAVKVQLSFPSSAHGCWSFLLQSPYDPRYNQPANLLNCPSDYPDSNRRSPPPQLRKPPRQPSPCSE